MLKQGRNCFLFYVDDVAASTDSKEVAVAVSVAVIILVAIVIAVIVCAYYKLKHRQNKIGKHSGVALPTKLQKKTSL